MRLGQAPGSVAGSVRVVIQAGTDLGQYRILEQSGQGGMATTYRALRAESGAEVSLKVVDPALANQPGFAERFRQEAARLADLRHPAILPLIDAGEVNGQAYLVYPVLRGGTLRAALGAPLALGEAVRLLAPIAAALDFAHQRGIVHGNVKPRNVLVAPDGAPVLAEFGLARLLEPLHGGGELQAALGTPAYMAPEQVQGRPLEGATDQYALGVIAYQMLTGSVPFSGADPEAVAWMHVREPLPLPRTRNPALPPAAEQALLVALARDPQARFPGCGAFVGALAQVAQTPQPAIAPTEMADPVRPDEDGTIFTQPRDAAAATAPPQPPAPQPTPWNTPPAGAPFGSQPVVRAPGNESTGQPAAGAFPLLALGAAVGFLIALAATFLEWATRPGKFFINAWHPDAPFRIGAWLGEHTRGGHDAIAIAALVVVGVALSGLALSVRRTALLPLVAALVGGVLAVLGVLELGYINGLPGRPGAHIGVGLGVYVLVVGGLVAAGCSMAEALRRQLAR